MKKIPYLLAFYFCIVCLNNSAQVVTTCADVTGFFNHLPSSTVNISGTPGGIFDTIYDRWGNKYNYSEIRINTDSTGYRPAAPSLTCAAGYFNVYFGVNSGMDSPTSPTHLQRRLAVCQVLENISGMVNTALITSTVRVNILVDDILSYYPNAATSGILGVASSYYVYPNNPPNPNPGIVDGQVYKTITTGQNAWNNYGIPLTGGPGFYHGVMSFNFANPSFTWNPTYSVTCPAAEYDLYTICLHELMHSMGFTSLLNYNGVSRMGAANNYYDRYDMFLKNQSPSFSVIASGGTCTPFYNLQYNPAAFLGQGSPSCTNSPPNTTTCSIAVMYTGNSYTVPIYTPQCWELGSSLNHFEDMCYPTPNPANNDQYFVMSNANGPGYMKRFLKEEERSVLCDLKYTLGNTYTSNAVFAPHVYSSSCTPPIIWGQNDGIVAGSYIYISFGGLLSIPKTGTTGILFNDSQPQVVDAICVQNVYPTSGTFTNNPGSITFSPSPGFFGATLLSYIPVDAAGNQGNITYIFIFVGSSNCTPVSPCNMVVNSGFETPGTATNCGEFWPFTPTVSIGCWSDLIYSPDLYKRGCPSTGGVYNLNTNTKFTTPPVNSHNGAPNNNVTGIYCESPSAAMIYPEAMFTQLTTSLIPGQVYNLSFWAYNYRGNMTVPPYPTGNVNTLTITPVLAFQSFSAPMSPSNIPNSFPVPGNTSLTSVSLAGPTNSWVPYAVTFTYNGGSAQQYFYLGHDCAAISANLVSAGYNFFSGSYKHYIFLDDISISQSTLTFNPPSPICYGGSINDLSQYLNPPLSGTFSGTGVTMSAGIYSFNAAPNNTLASGNYPLIFSYNIGGCTFSIGAAITITNTAPPFTFTLAPAMCQNTGISNMSVCISPTAYANGGIFTGTGIYTFPNPPYTGYGLTLPMIPGNLGLQTYTYIYPNIVLTNTAVVGGTLSCTAFATATTIVIPAITLSTALSPSTGCVPQGQSATITASSNYTNAVFAWQPGNLTGPTIVVSPTATTIYTVTANNGTCSTFTTVTVNIIPLPQFTNTPLTLCTGQYIYYLENWLAPGTPTGGIWTVPFITSPTATAGLTAGYLNPTITPTGTQVIAYTYSTMAGCSAANSFTVNILPGFVLNTNGMSTYCTNLGIGAFLNATASPSANVSFTWIPGNLVGPTQTVFPGSPTTYTVIATNTLNSCQFDATTFVDVRNDCCPAANYVNAAVLNNTVLTGQWAINQNVTITGSVGLQGEFLIAPNVTITVVSGATLSTDRFGAHIYSCNDMWWGVMVMNGGHAFFDGFNVIEDALEGLSTTGSTSTSTVNPTILVRNTTFNRCYYGITIRNYNLPSNGSPGVYQNCVFTCRDLQIVPGSTNSIQWAAATAPALLTSNGQACSRPPISSEIFHK